MKRYEICLSENVLANLQRKIADFDWSNLPDDHGWDHGVGKADLKRLVEYWRDRFDWRATERRLNELPHYLTTVENQPVHFIHIKGDGSKPPLMLLHGWPGSFIEFGQLLEPLAADGHDIVVPSLPGFAFSNPVTSIIGPARAAGIMHSLMVQLFGDERYIVQGGDWGAHIASWMAYYNPDALLGFHVNMAYIFAEDAMPTSEAEKQWLSQRDANLRREGAYSQEQETRPDTLGAALTDSPTGAAAWILEKFGMWSDLPEQADGSPDLWARYTEEQLLTNIMLYVGTSAMATATWIYRGMRLEQSNLFPAGTRIKVPMAVAAFPDPVFIPAPRSFLAKTYNVVRYTDMPSGGHFAALEEPHSMLADLRSFIATIAASAS
ncbi:epoxide hydrolase [Erwinia sp. 9145]|uniref:epoxide hydrolase n=1 Tax=Erwinia sp. 9145 TaxID=1500895 RepID=UPI00054F13C4|nr:epoxide hydrolase [Erwinia sp. 9145]